MKLHQADLEIPFEAAFDAEFPYNKGCLGADKTRLGYFPERCFLRLHELCRPPHGAGVSSARLRELLAEWSTGPNHPLKQPLLQCAIALFEGRPLPWQEGVKLMERIRQYDGQIAALAIAYFAAIDETAGKRRRWVKLIAPSAENGICRASGMSASHPKRTVYLRPQPTSRTYPKARPAPGAGLLRFLSRSYSRRSRRGFPGRARCR